MPPTVCPAGPKVLVSKRAKNPRAAPVTVRWARGTKNKTSRSDGFDVQTQLVGVSPSGRVTVYVDTSGPSGAAQNAADVLGWADEISKWHDALFGFTGGNVNVIVSNLSGTGDGTGGAYHYGCSFPDGADLYVDACNGNSGVVAGLFAAELSECFMGPNPGQMQTNPWGCGFSNGEGLSRVCANEVCALVGYPGALDQLGYGAAAQWNTADDWITKTEQTDQDADSSGAAMVAIDWLRANGYPLYKVAQAPCDTVEMAYTALTGKTGFYSVLVSAVGALVGGVTDDYPFTKGPNPSGAIPGGVPPGPPPPTPPGPPVPPGGQILTATGYVGSSGSGLPVTLTGQIVPAPGAKPARTVNWLRLLAALSQLSDDIEASNWGAAPADIWAVLTAAGFALKSADKAAVCAAFSSHK